MAMNPSFELSGGDLQSGEYETIEKSRPPASLPNPAFEEGPDAGLNNRRGTKQERVCSTRCMLIVTIIYGILLAVMIALLCFVIIQIFQLKAKQGVRSEPGDKGVIGAQGPPGQQGEKGETGLQGQAGINAPGSGAIYTRWGRKTCSDGEVDLVYSGVAGGSWYGDTGSGANYLCLTREPQWGNYSDVDDAANGLARGTLYGAEYENVDTIFPGKGLYNHDVPCAVCRPRHRSTVMMIPGRLQCPKGWTREYPGYLMTTRYGHVGRTIFECMDADPEVIQGGAAGLNGATFYPVEAKCGSLPCPNYVNNREVTCVVCSQ